MSKRFKGNQRHFAMAEALPIISSEQLRALTPEEKTERYANFRRARCLPLDGGPRKAKTR